MRRRPTDPSSSKRRASHSATRVVHAGGAGDPTTGAVNVPVYLTSTYRRAGVDGDTAFDYARTVNPTRSALERAVAELEGGARGLAFASGMAAITAVTRLLRPGDRVVAVEAVYGGTWRLLDTLPQRGIEVDWVDGTDDGAVAAALRPTTRLVWVETPSNPGLRITDLRRAARALRGHPALLAVDNTFMTPCAQRPLELGADLVVHSTTKSLNGHSDGVGGCVVARDAGVAERLAWLQNAEGAILAPFDSFLVLRGIRTLALRVEHQGANAMAVARRLARHPRVRGVLYPGLVDHPQHALARRQMTGFGGVVAVDLGTLSAVRRFVSRLRLWTFAESLGGVESLVAHPASMSHHAMPASLRQRVGVGPGLVRLSAGIEDSRDLIDDLLSALE